VHHLWKAYTCASAEAAALQVCLLTVGMPLQAVSDTAAAAEISDAELAAAAPAQQIRLQVQVITSLDKVRSAHWTTYAGHARYLCFTVEDARHSQLCPMSQVSADEWDRCATGSGETNPFTLHCFLHTLERAACAVGAAPAGCCSIACLPQLELHACLALAGSIRWSDCHPVRWSCERLCTET
jgi:Peptidogalycan biosysnthesis/recognition